MQVFSRQQTGRVVGFIGGVLFTFGSIAYAAPPMALEGQGANATLEGTQDAIDYSGFMELVETVAPIRESRLISLADFNQMARDPNTLLLDTRSAADFAAGHIEGAVNLNFSEFTVSKLAAVIGTQDRRILIYCNNNFTDNIPPIMTKIAPLALNVPTFINLYGYGYENIYELGETISITDSQLEWVGGTDTGISLMLE